MTTSMTKTFVFNKKKPEETPVDIKCEFSGFVDQPMFKYADFNFVRERSIPLVQKILDTCPLRYDGFERFLVDIKLHSLDKGECPCLFGWHLDGHPNPWHYDVPALYHLFLVGPMHSRTIFLKHPTELDVLDSEDPKKISENYCRQLADMKPDYYHAPENTWVTFTSEDFHSGPVFNKPANRVLLRVAETNWIVPRNKVVKEAFVQRN